MSRIMVVIWSALLVVGAAEANEGKASHYCSFGEGVEKVITLKNNTLTSLAAARDMCPEYVVTETKRDEEAYCKLELKNVVKVFNHKYECVYK
ncbi:hypothetical protein [Aeromonas aquatica]|uniref:hypothetical protein n=1 Tax=Aeromonas aquatica TaxID=558964 RepID=UPI00126A0EE1|nr:hypothetical protein [Aeromonas aquatica]